LAAKYLYISIIFNAINQFNDIHTTLGYDFYAYLELQ